MPNRVQVNNFEELLDGMQGSSGLPVKGSVASYPDPNSCGVLVNLASRTTTGLTVTRANGVEATKYNLLKGYEIMTVMCNLTAAATEAGDTFDVYVDLSLDAVTWFNAIHFTQMLGNGGAKIFVAQLSFPTVAVADINVTADAAANAARNLWAPHVRAGYAAVDANANNNAIFTYRVDAWLQAF